MLSCYDEMNRKKDKKHSARSAGRIIIENAGQRTESE